MGRLRYGVADDFAQGFRADGAGRQMVVFNQNAVGQIQAVVPAAAHADAVLVQKAMAGGGFAGVHNAGAGAGHGGHIAAGGGGDAAHPLHKVEGGAFRPQDGRRRAPHAGDVLPRNQDGAVLQPQDNLQVGVNAPEYGGGHRPAGQHAVRFGAQNPAANDVVRYQGLRGGVVKRLVLGKSGVNQIEDFRRELLGHSASPGLWLLGDQCDLAASLPRLRPPRNSRRRRGQRSDANAC